MKDPDLVAFCGPHCVHRCSSASNSRSGHALLNTLYTLQVLESLLMYHINIQLFHDLNYDVQRLEEPIHSYTQHAVRCSLVLRLQNSLVLIVPRVFTGEQKARVPRRLKAI
jgi:hypothetical protein